MSTSESGNAGHPAAGGHPARSADAHPLNLSLFNHAPGVSEAHLFPLQSNAPTPPSAPAMPAPPEGPAWMPRLPTMPTSLEDIRERIESAPESFAIRLEEAKDNEYLNQAARQVLGGLQGSAAKATKPLMDPKIMPRLPSMPVSLEDIGERIQDAPESFAIRLEEAKHNLVVQDFVRLLHGNPGSPVSLPGGLNFPANPASAPHLPGMSAAPMPGSPSMPSMPATHGVPSTSGMPGMPGMSGGAPAMPSSQPTLPRMGTPAGAPAMVPPSAPAMPGMPTAPGLRLPGASGGRAPVPPELAAFAGPLAPIVSLPLSPERLNDPACLLGAAAKMFAPTSRSYAEPAGWTSSIPSLGRAPVPSAPSAPHGHSAPSAPAPAAEAPSLGSGASYYFIDSHLDEPVTPGGDHAFDVEAVRRDFPIFRQKVNGRPLVWLDNAATTQKPQAVIDRLVRYYETENSNVHRAAHELAARATNAYEAARAKVQEFLGAAQKEEIIFTRGTTESINLLAQTLGNQIVGRDDEIVITHIEHHSNIVPWQHLAARTGARLRVAPVNDRGEIDLDAYERLLGSRTKIVAMTHVSNALGTIVPVREMTASAHRHGARVLVDGAQSTPHFPIDVQDIGCDFLALSGHKLFGPTGIGVLYGRKDLLDSMPPWQGGGNMIQDVTFEKTTYNPAPMKFEAGTAILAGAIGLGAAIDYLNHIGFDRAAAYEHSLFLYASDALQRVPGLKMVGNAREKAGVLSFVLAGAQPEAIGEALNREGIAVRTGHHCAQPALRRFGYERTVRPSLAFYNTRDEVDLLVHTLHRVSRG